MAGPTTAQRALLRFLQRRQLVSPEKATQLEQIAERDGLSIQEVLEREQVVTERDLAAMLAEDLKLKRLDLASYHFDPETSRVVKESLAMQYQLLPVAVQGRVIEVATANPLDVEGLKAVEFALGKRLQPVVVTRTELRNALAQAYRFEESFDDLLQSVPQHQDALTIEEDRSDVRVLAREADLPPVVKLADIILIEGTKNGASDVHIEPVPEGLVVRYRVDGILEEGFRFPKWVQNLLITRFKVMAKLDIAERRVPQDGRVQVHFDNRTIDYRVSSLPTQHGEKITLRILDAARAVKTIDRLGFSAPDLRRLREAVNKPQGMVLVTGPTGSGKTTTLYGLIREIFSPTRNIITIENPIEYQLKGINQVEVNEKQGLNFAGVLRSVLRQDPDVILVGEIRDQETARVALQAAQTGHLVLSTLHTNDAAATITRLIDLGIESYVVASSLNLVVAQRLVRRLCPTCRVPDESTPELRKLLGLEAARGELRRGKGCRTCRDSGYVGRLGVYEVLPVTPAIAKLIESGASESAIRQQTRAEGLTTLQVDACAKVVAGETSVDEVMRVVQVSGEDRRCPSCQRDVPDGQTDCPNCGAALRPCPRCGSLMAASGESCQCGFTEMAGAAVPLPPAGPRPRTFKALIVDDEPNVRDIVALMLETSKLGLTTVQAEDGATALTLAAAERPDIVILDRAMPGMDGFEVCRRLRADPKTADLPILLLTAHDSPELVEEGFAAGADDYLVKPARRQDLAARVRRMLERTYGKDSALPADGSSPAGPPPRAEGRATVLGATSPAGSDRS